jgi:hypothetical protein
MRLPPRTNRNKAYITLPELPAPPPAKKRESGRLISSVGYGHKKAALFKSPEYLKRRATRHLGEGEHSSRGAHF